MPWPLPLPLPLPERVGAWAWRALALTLLTACGATPAPTGPTTPVGIPDTVDARNLAIDQLGHRAWAAMSAGDPRALLYADTDLDVLLDSGATARVAARRLALDERLAIDPAALRSPLATAEYAGICLQGARAVPAGGPIGLVADGWVFDRLLIIGRRPTGRRVAAWIEGIFVYSDAGFGAIDLERVEEPRWEHSDLEIAPCDLSIRNDLPEIAR